MDPPVRKRGRPRKEEQPKRGRPKANVDVTRKSATSQSFDTEKEKRVENINASEQKISGEIKTRSAAVKNSASSKLRPPKPPPYTNKEKWNRMNNGQKLYAMRQYNLSLIRRGLPVDKTLPGSFNFKSSNFTFSAIPYGSVKKPKISDSNFAKNTQPNTVIKPKSSDSSRSKNDQPDSTIDYEIIPSANLEKTKSLDLKQIDYKIEKIEKALGLKKAENKLEKREKSLDSKKVENKLRKTDSKKIENKESGKKLEASEKAPPRKKIVPVSEDESSDDSDSETEESGTEREMPDLDLYKAEEKQPSTQKEIQIPNLSVSEKIGSKKMMKASGLSSSKGNLKEIQTPDLSGPISEKIGTKKEMKHSGLSSAKGTQKEIQTSVPSGSNSEKMSTKKEIKDSGLNSAKKSAKKTDVKIRTSVYTFTTKCDRQRRSTGILTKKPISVVSPKKISTITMKYRERNRKATKPDEIPTLSKEVDTAGNDSNVIIIQKKVPEKQNLANTSNSLKTKHGANSVDTVPVKKLSETDVEYQEQKKSNPDVKQFLEDSNVKKTDAEVIAIVKEEPVSPSSSLPNTSSSLHINNSEGAIPVEKLSITEMECKEQRNSNPDERQQDPNAKENAAEVAIVKEEQKEPERPISSLLHHAPSVVQKNNPENIVAVQSIPTVEMTLEKQSTSTANPSGRSSRLSIRVKSIDSSSLETNSDGSPSTLSLIRQILEDQNPRMINPYVCPSDVSVVKIPVKISRLSRSQNSKITNSIGNPLVTEKLDCQESMPIVIKEEPQKEESESQNLLKDKTCLNSEDTKNTSDVMKTGSISDVLDHETERVESVGEINLDVLKTNSTSDILEHDTERIELVEKINLDVLENDSVSNVLEHIEKHANVIASVEDANSDIVKTDFTSVVLEPEIKGAASAEEVELDKAILNSPEDISNAEFCEKKDEEKELSITQLNNVDAHVSEVETNELEATIATESDIGKIVDLEAIDSNLTDTTETEESDMVTEEIPQTLEILTETDNMDIRENTKVKMQSYEEAVLHFPEIKCKSFQALKDNNLDSSLHSTRMYKKLPECVVVLHRLTEEDLHKSYPSESEDNYGISYDVKRKTDELCETVEGMDASERRDGNFRIVRRIPRSNASAFELYKQKRERYMNRRNRAYHSENSLDMSQDESRTFSDGAKPKKKLKRGRRYERDFEWRPDIPKGILNSDRKLRRRTSVIESDSSSSSDDDEEFMYNLYIGYDDPYGNEETASSNAVPSDDTSSTAASNNCELEKQPSDKYSSSHQNSSLSSELKSASQSVDPGSFDIVSGIIKNMENQHNSKLKTSYNTSQHSKTKQSNDFIKTEQKKRKRPRMPSRKDKNSEIDPNKIVASILKEMVNKVSSKLKKCPEKQINKASKICKWCTTPFQPNRSSDVKCAICTDLGNGEVNKSLSSNKKSPNTLKIKCFKENKGKKTNSAMSRVLKKLSENEKQRLIYSEKSDTKTSGKGYNHCKSFLTPKDTISKSESDVNLNASQNKTPNKLSLKGNKISTKLNQKNYKSDVNVNNNKCDKTQIKPVIRIKPNIPANVEKPQNKPNKNYDENKQNKSRVSLEKKNDGLFLMTFPDPDEEIDFDDKLSQSQVSKSGTSSESANNLISKQSTTESSSQSMKQSQSVSMKKYDTYLFPPIPTVIVSNYCSDTSSLNLSHTYFQNEITHQHAIKNSTALSNTVNSNPVMSLNNTVAPIANTIAYQNSPISSNFTSNNSTPLRTFPFNTNNQMKSILNTEAANSVNNISILPKSSVPAGSSTVLSKTPISLSNVTISNLLSKTPIPASMAVLPNMSISANTVTILPKVSVPSNSVTILPKSSSSITMLPIVTSVISLSDKNSALSYKIKENLPSSFSSDNFVNSLLSEIKINNVTSLKDDQSLLNSEPATHKDINKRLPSDSDTDENALFENKSHSSAKRKKLNSERFSSDYSEPSDREDVTKKSIAIEKDNSDNLTSNNQPSDSPEKEKSTESNSNDQKEQESSGSKESDKSSDDKEKTTPQSAISVTQSAIDLLGAISILAVIDLEQNPQKGLNVRIQVAKSQLNKLTSEKISTPEHNERIASCQYNLTLLNIAKKYLSIYGTFAKVSDHLLRKANMANMIQIKKELHEEETNQSSCMFSQPTHLNTSFSDRQSDVSRTVQMSPVNNQMQNFASSRSAAQTPINHIEKLKSQIAAMNNVNMNNVDLSQYGIFPGGGTIHHYPVEQIAALNHAVAAPAPMMPRNDCLGNESRETPSRGSGPRTPARPESAASQSEDTASLIQIKKEQFETATSPSSQCAYAQNTTLPQISSQLPVMSEMPTLMPQHSIPNAPMHLPVSNANQAYTNQTNYSVHSSGMAPNRTVAYTHQTYSDMYLNVTSKPQMQITPATTSAEMRQNQQVLLGQQMYIQNGSGLCSKQAVPSVNNNQYVIRPPYTTANTGGTLIVNNTQVGQNALLTNVSNQQFYTSNQVSQLYYPPSAQMTCMPNNNMPTMITQDVTAAQVQQAESPEQMICAVCNKQATLRCKQCARVAYCNTACAKTYWHQKHKMECKPVGS